MNKKTPSPKSLFAAVSLLAAATAWAGPPVQAVDGVLVGANGMTLYIFDKDNGDKSVCNGPCATNWPPLMAAADAMADGDYRIIVRDDGSRQWALKGKPLYYWVKDQKPGDRSGDGFNGVWKVAKP